ncbi:hypothetical protein CRUP_000602 [Coryphaenoides rupestris]|nr:hypothetical protein CRUP_000602 [Coryphaenoides rupestris]
MATGAVVYCVCRLPYDVTQFMIECDACKDWFHGSCVGVDEDDAPDIDIYHCPNCEKNHGKSTLKKKKNWNKGRGHGPDGPDDQRRFWKWQPRCSFKETPQPNNSQVSPSRSQVSLSCLHLPAPLST